MPAQRPGRRPARRLAAPRPLGGRANRVVEVRHDAQVTVVLAGPTSVNVTVVMPLPVPSAKPSSDRIRSSRDRLGSPSCSRRRVMPRPQSRAPGSGWPRARSSCARVRPRASCPRKERPRKTCCTSPAAAARRTERGEVLPGNRPGQHPQLPVRPDINDTMSAAPNNHRPIAGGVVPREPTVTDRRVAPIDARSPVRDAAVGERSRAKRSPRGSVPGMRATESRRRCATGSRPAGVGITRRGARNRRRGALAVGRHGDPSVRSVQCRNRSCRARAASSVVAVWRTARRRRAGPRRDPGMAEQIPRAAELADWDPVRARRLRQERRVVRYRDGSWPSARMPAPSSCGPAAEAP
jgi:hypothetical protein